MATTATGVQGVSWRTKGLGSVVDVAVTSHARAVAVLLAVALLAFLPGISRIPPIDRDEARFAQVTKQMVESGDYVDIRVQDDVRYKNPVGIYWLQAGAVKAATALGKRDALTTIGLNRIPSLVGAIGAVLLTYWAALAFVSRRAAVLAGLMMACSMLLLVQARLARTDALLLATIVATMGALARAYLGEQRTRPGLAGWIVPAIFWTALAGGILTKGPVVLVLVGLTVGTLLVIDRSARWLLVLRPLAGVIWLAVLVLPWLISVIHLTGAGLIIESIGRDLLSTALGGQERHGAPPGAYFVVFWATFWPAATLAVMAAPAIWASRRERGARFLLAWIVPCWIVLELMITKLPHYVLPLYPAIAILIAGVVDAHMLVRKRWMKSGAAWWFVLPVLLAIAGIVGLVMASRQLGLLAWPFLAGAVIFGLLAWWLFDSDGAEQSLLRAMAASILISIALGGIIIPALSSLFPSVSIARVLRQAECKNPTAASAGYLEPSLMYLLGTSTSMTDGNGAADFLHLGGCRFAIVEARHERGFLRRADVIGLRYSSGPRVDGFNYSTGQWLSIAIYRSDAAP